MSFCASQTDGGIAEAFIEKVFSAMESSAQRKSAYEQKQEASALLQRLNDELRDAQELKPVLKQKREEAWAAYAEVRKDFHRDWSKVYALEKRVSKNYKRSKRKPRRTERPYDEYELANESLYAMPIAELGEVRALYEQADGEYRSCYNKIGMLKNKIKQTKKVLREASVQLGKEVSAYRKRCWDEAKAAACEVAGLSEAEKADATIACRPMGKAGILSVRLFYGNDGVTHGHAEISCENGDVIYHRPPAAPRGPHNFTDKYRYNPDFFIEEVENEDYEFIPHGSF